VSTSFQPIPTQRNFSSLTRQATQKSTVQWEQTIDIAAIKKLLWIQEIKIGLHTCFLYGRLHPTEHHVMNYMVLLGI
jgi:hypothetical protein